MSTPAITQQIVEYFKTQPVVKAWLFGSYARGEETENSDIDILIQPEQSVGLFKLSGMHLDLQDMLHIDVDLVTVKGLLPFARKSADRDKILIYERTALRQNAFGAYTRSHRTLRKVCRFPFKRGTRDRCSEILWYCEEY